MPDYTPLIAASDVPTGKAVRVSVAGNCYVVCNDAGKYYVADCVCPHAGGPLGGADVCDGCVVCPVHHWPWDLTTGLTDPAFPQMRLPTYPCEVRSGTVFAVIAPHESRPDLDCRS